MRKIYSVALLVLIATVATLSSSAQGYWSSRTDNSVTNTDKAVKRLAFPKEFKLFALNIEPLRQQLFTVTDNQRRSTIISLPNADGGIEQFEVFEASNFAPELQARFPQIRAFSGRGITDKYATLKLSISPQGVQTMVFRADKPSEYIEPYSLDHTVYAAFKSQRSIGQLPWTCSTPDVQLATDLNNQVYSRIESNVGQLKTMRLAQSCNGEYSNYFGAFSAAQVGLVLAAYNATLTRCNGCYEKDLAIHLNLIPNTDLVIFYDPLTDPYTTLANWNNQLQATLTSIIGEANYDIGHMFGASGGGGNAGCIGCVCVDGQKGRGITSPADGIPMGDNFDIDYVAHEVGHQMGGNHTFSFQIEAGGVNNVEVGSGITIMGYAGITAQDVAPHSIDIFHERSIQQIQVNMAGKTCPITISLAGNNATPVVAAVSNYTIPISTPFALTGSATDADGDPLTYNWEQNDAANSTVVGANSVAFPTKLVGPNWLSWPSTVSPTRLLPKLSTILAGLSITPCLPGGDPIANTEALSSVGRTLNFRLTVKDNVPYVAGVEIGQTNFTDMTVTVSAAVGPFLITSQNVATNWPATSTQTVTWSVNGTTGAPTNTSNVNILFSSDGGNNFTMLVPNTLNDGTEDITVPGVITSQARIKVEAIGNIYFDINNSNINITPPPNGFSFNSPGPISASCPAAGPMTASLTATFFGSFAGPVTLSATAFPPGTNVTFGTNPLSTGSPTTTVNLNNTSALIPGNYTVTVQGTGAAVPTQTRDITFTINPGAGPAISAHPANASICVTQNTTFSITSAAATSFQWQVSTDGGSTWNNVVNGGVYSNATTPTLSITGATLAMNNYRYRCNAGAQCGTSTSNSATLTVNASAAISGNPSDQTLCAGGSATFTVTATGTGLTYQWEESTDAGATYHNAPAGAPFSGQTTTALTINPITAGMNGYRYRAVVTGSGACPAPVTSTAAILNVVTSVTITTQPTNQTVCAGGNTSFTVAGSGAGVIYVWQVSTDGGSTWNNVSNGGVYSGATSGTLTITGATVAMNNYRYRALLSNSTCTTPGTSNAVILTVNSLPAISANPNNSTICVGGNTTFGTTASGTGITYQWQVSTDLGVTYNNLANGGVYSNVTTATMNITGATFAMNTYRYRVVVTGTCPPAATSTGAILTVVQPVSIGAPGQPVNSDICSGTNTSFSVTGTSTEAMSHQWQVSTDAGATWNNVPAAAPYSGTTSPTLTITSAPVSLHTYRYRALVSNVSCTAPTASNAATLFVRQIPTISLAATSTSLLPGQSSILTVTNTTPGTTNVVTWQFNGAALVVSGSTYTANVEHVGNYQAFITSNYGTTTNCSAQSAVVTINATASSRLFIFPSPNDGRFTVSYYNNGGTSTQRQIAIYDSKGSRVLNKKFPITGAYTLIPIDLRTSNTGIYYVVVADAQGNKLADGKVHVR